MDAKGECTPDKGATGETFNIFCMEQLVGQDASMGAAGHLLEDQML